MSYRAERFTPLEPLWAKCQARLPKWLRPDPTQENWRRFRPLSVKREEDWSDWLAHVLEFCPQGRLHWRLFGDSLGPRIRVRREVTVEWDGVIPPGSPFRTPQATSGEPASTVRARADLILIGESETVHVEVKVGEAEHGYFLFDSSWKTFAAPIRRSPRMTSSAIDAVRR